MRASRLGQRLRSRLGSPLRGCLGTGRVRDEQASGRCWLLAPPLTVLHPEGQARARSARHPSARPPPAGRQRGSRSTLALVGAERHVQPRDRAHAAQPLGSPSQQAPHDGALRVVEAEAPASEGTHPPFRGPAQGGDHVAGSRAPRHAAAHRRRLRVGRRWVHIQRRHRHAAIEAV